MQQPITESDLQNTLYQINQVVVESSEGKRTLDKVIKLARSIFIFDNLVVYLAEPETQNLEVMYAKAVGRGRSVGADITWGEFLASRISETRQTILEEPELNSGTDRLKLLHKLGLPMLVNNQYLGAIILIRFGGPRYTPDDIQLAKFIANQIALIVERKNLLNKNRTLEIQQRQFQLQDDFISTITHELRSPLGFIKGYATTLLRDDTTWDQKTQQEFLSIIDRETDHLQDLIENLLDSARLQSGQLDMKFQPVRLDALINDVVMRARLNHPSLVIHIEVPPKLNSIQANPRRISQVLENLLSNAVKYAPNSDVWIKVEQDAENAYLTVKDNGPGIEKDYLESIFQRFFRNPHQPPTIHGSGLGLYICKQIVQAHGGDIVAHSNPGEGMAFKITLPCHSADNSANSQ